MQTGFHVVVLARETQVDDGDGAVVVRVVVGGGLPKGVALPLPHQLLVLVGGFARGVQVIRVQVDHSVIRIICRRLQHGNGHGAEPDVVFGLLDGAEVVVGGFAEQLPRRVVEVGGAACIAAVVGK